MIGILGGTFDPVHFGHLRPALEVRQALGLREVRLVPLRFAVHRPQPLASPDQRLAMLRAAVAQAPGLVIDDRELRRPRPSYSFDTLRELRDELGPKEGICLILGADAFRGFLSWHRPDGILELAHLVVMRRPALAAEVLTREALAVMDLTLANWSWPRLCDQAGDLAAAPAGRIWFQEVTQLEISATRIRGLVAQGLSPRFLLPDPVLDYILAGGLYRPAAGAPAPDNHPLPEPGRTLWNSNNSLN